MVIILFHKNERDDQCEIVFNLESQNENKSPKFVFPIYKIKKNNIIDF